MNEPHHLRINVFPTVICFKEPVYRVLVRGGYEIFRRRNVQGCWKVLSPTRKETNYNDSRFCCLYIQFIIIIGRILVLYMYINITRLTSNEIFSPSNKMQRGVDRAKDLSAPWYILLTWEKKLLRTIKRKGFYKYILIHLFC